MPQEPIDTIRGADLLVRCLLAQGVDQAYCVPGESYLAVLDALYDVRDRLRLVVCRQEGGAANMAEAHGKLTGRPGVCFVTRGPGATNAAIGVHTAFQDSTPMVLFVGQVARGFRDREAFQEVDFRAMFGPLVKWVAEIDDPARIPEYVHRAFQTALAGRPGPVVLSLPEDMLTSLAPAATDLGLAAHPLPQAIAAGSLARVAEALAVAERPLLVLGGGGWTAEAGRDIARFAEAWSVPVVASLRCQDYMDNDQPAYCGHLAVGAEPALVARMRAADLLVVLGARLGEMTTAGYRIVTAPRAAQKLVHIHPDPEELGHVYQADVPVVAGGPDMAAALAGLGAGQGPDRSGWLAACRADYATSLIPPAEGAEAGLDLARAVIRIRGRCPADTIIATGAGNYTAWVHKYWPCHSYRSQLAPTSGAMGYSVPAAVAAAIAEPGRQVVAFAGDGCFMMNGQELATAAQYGAKLLVVVVNNGTYGTIRMHQEREYPGRVHGTTLANPDFAALARAYGLHGETVRDLADLDAALDRALGATGAALIELVTETEAISLRSTISGLRTRGNRSNQRNLA